MSAHGGGKDGQSHGATVQLDDQRSSGGSVMIETLRTKKASTLYLLTDEFDVLAEWKLSANVRRGSHSIELRRSLTARQEITALLIERPGTLAAGDVATVSLGDADSTLTVRDQSGTGALVDISQLRTDVDASLFVFDATGRQIGGSGVRFVGGTEIDSLTVPLESPLEGSQSVRVVLYESNGGPIAETTAFLRVEDAGPATLTVEEQTSDGSSIDVSHLWTAVDSSLFVFDESGDVVGGSGVTFDAGDEVTDRSVDLDESLESTQEVTVTLYESNGGPIATETATVEVSDGGSASITFDDQTSDGTTVEIASLRTPVDSSLFVFDEADTVIGGSGVTFDAGDEVTDRSVDLDESLDSTQDVTVTLYESNGGPIAEATASVTVE
ncbi:hypothetical protein C479_05403 [Halovivax asiaticus JCM 14624]|uniref:Uncharacterized protein n=2 Tax=Halovivax asiaticus TaxID=332953 RepID=M0BPH8_9EURY|nr:hypothetical protein C479_05403 [Halovivax asiaticus JCM 14624]